jgi:hypothetical protein
MSRTHLTNQNNTNQNNTNQNNTNQNNTNQNNTNQNNTNQNNTNQNNTNQNNIDNTDNNLRTNDNTTSIFTDIFTEEDLQNIKDLCELGFEENQVIKVYLITNRNKELSASVLYDFTE